MALYPHFLTLCVFLKRLRIAALGKFTVRGRFGICAVDNEADLPGTQRCAPVARHGEEYEQIESSSVLTEEDRRE